MLLIGSRALAFWDHTFKPKEDADWDIICKEEDKEKLHSWGKENGNRIEIHDYNHLNNGAIYDKYYFGKDIEVAPLGVLALIKRSHLWRDYKWDKHITQYHKHLMKQPFAYPPELLNERIKLTKEAYPQGQPSLMKPNEDFFDDAVEKVYDHDSIHELAAFYEEPLYLRLKLDFSSAWCVKDLWDLLSHEDQLKCVAEETYVIATERFLVRKNWDWPYKLAYFEALKKVCTTLTSGYFRDKAIDYYPEIVSLFDTEKFTFIKENLK